MTSFAGAVFREMGFIGIMEGLYNHVPAGLTAFVDDIPMSHHIPTLCLSTQRAVAALSPLVFKTHH